jgi:ligand-binding sensor domain-containing protein/signal transduction histidine kinase/CheY-like chemotaxis protein
VLLSVVCFFLHTKSASALDPERALTQYAMQLWQVEQGLPHNTVIVIAQTPDGYLWCGTEKGLTRFDGNSFTLFDRSNTPAIQHNTIHSLLTDRDGRLWIGTGGGGLVRLVNGEFTQFTVEHGLVGNTVQTLVQDRAGAVWIGTTQGLSRYASSRFTNFTVTDGLPSDYCRDICEDEAGRLWVATGQGLSCLSEGRFKTYTSRDGLASDNIQLVRRCKDGGLWVGIAGDGLFRWKEGRFTRYAASELLSGGLIRTLLEDRDGNLWVSTNGGVSRWKDGKQTGLFPPESFGGGFTNSLYEDGTGSLWVGSGDGLIRLGDGRCITFTTTEGLGSNIVWSVYEDRTGRLWVGSNGGLGVRKNGQWTTYTSKHGLPSDAVLSVCEDAAGVMWLGTPVGLTRLRDGKFETFTTADGLSGNYVLAVYADRKGTLWIGTNGGGVSCYREGRFTRITRKDGLPHDIVRVFLEDSQGNLWIGTNGGGLGVLKDGRFTRYTTNEGLSSDLVLSISEDGSGAIWVGTHGGGLNRFQNGTWVSFGAANGFPNEIIYQVLEHGPHLWMSSSMGIFRVAKNELETGKRISPLVLGKFDGMRILDCSGGSQPAGIHARDGRLWFPTARGLVVVNPSQIQANTNPPTVLIERVLADGVHLEGTTSFTVLPGTGRLEFHYAAIDLSTTDRVRFRYRLERFEKEWVEAGARRVAYYTNLPPGHYRFHVNACNGDGVWRESPASVDLELEPHFYQTTWFYGSCAVLMLAVGTGIHLVRTRHLRAREKYLARCVEDRTRQLQQEVEEHARTNERLRQSQKLEAIGQLAGGVAHDFNNLLTVINGCTELLLENETLDAQEKGLVTEVRAAGGRAEGLTQQLLAFSRRQVLEPKILDLNAVITGTARMLGRMIGEDIILTTALDPQAFRVKVDPVQLQQVLVNLVVNARDAMPRGGRLTIKTWNVEQDETSARLNPDVPPGQYVLLAVSDTGCGMTTEVKERVFEPFFTTKGPGKGTGLGLATVYGIVRQSEGHLTVQSEVGVGTTFQVYLPKATGVPEKNLPTSTLPSVPSGRETILLVEDEPSVRAVARHVLLTYGYQVVEAGDGQEALAVAAAFTETIHLLASDVVMPNLGGRQLAEELQKLRPEMRILFLSGYTDDAILRHGVLEAGIAFLHKPYTPAALVSKVREVLDEAPLSSAAPQLVG